MKLNRKVLGMVLLGIAAVFAGMILINGIIFSFFTQGKTGYYLSLFFSNSLFILLILGIMRNQNININDIGWRKTKLVPALKNIVLMWFATWICYFLYLIVLALAGFTPQENGLYEMLADPTGVNLVINLLAIVVVAPLVEETLFRGLLFGSLFPYFGKWVSIVVSSALFSALHFDPVGFFPRFVLGICLGYLYVKNDSLFPAMGLHGLNNFVALMLVYLVN
ncbi:Abortive infection protein [Syntrophobotulus glycolicus DSM 8271]|uniref:Abortive infection protein n=1 Tax=Syntrophobotulus glycolicus (strain DSM 8271 / FlGlyR) TaxID=645991 RepID=F0SYU9_SYNGF|nr:type II CAAX endopeptidase family protein [Syntrophobotulus glycolicus]ADY55986.1 Abortive infection protein [Syntrophobotulus glycolicus DSM 8271]